MTMGQLLDELRKSLIEISNKFDNMLKSNRYIETKIDAIQDEIKDLKKVIRKANK